MTKPDTKSPRFITTQEKKFSEKKGVDRTFNDKKLSEKSFHDRKGREKRDVAPRNADSTIYPTEGKKADGVGHVKIMVKGGQEANVKKTGPLSPRAPEKIRNNRATEMKIYGENACRTLFQQRPESIVRLWATVEGAKKAGELLSYLAEQKKAYHVVDREELERVTGTEHHGGLCLLVKKASPFSLEGYLQVARRQDCLVLLDEVNNAQNIGGIIRTCAVYGIKGIVVDQADLLNASAAARVAEGGLEFVHALETKHKEIALTQLRQAGYQVVHLTRDKHAQPLAKTHLREKVVFVLSENVSTQSGDNDDSYLRLSASNPLNSGLNVAVNAGILLAHWSAQYHF